MPKNKKPCKKKRSFSTKKSPNNIKKIVDKALQKGAILYRQGSIKESLKVIKQALKQAPSNVALLSNAGALADTLNQPNLAVKYYQRTLQLNSNDVHAHNSLANLFKQRKQFEKATEHYQIALKINPNYADAHNNLANLLKEQKQFKKADKHYKIALKVDPNHIKARCNLSLLQLTLSNFRQGWKNYEYRYRLDKKDEAIALPNTTIAQYQGEDLNSRNLLVYCEQGFGDALQFIRYLPLLKPKKGVKGIVLVCEPSLKKLFSRIDCIDYLLDINEFDNTNIQNMRYWVFIASLPLYFNTILETIPNQLPYLYSPKQQQSKWQDKLPKGFNIGLVWKGSKAHANDENRSLPSIKTLKPLWQLQNKRKDKASVNFISLQKGEGEGEAKNPPTNQPLIHLGSKVQDFADTAAIVSQLDLVICVDTAIAHLAGSLNTPCWVLLPYYGADWRWMEYRDDSPWYPNTMQLFRQTKDADWDGVVDCIVVALVQDGLLC